MGWHRESSGARSSLHITVDFFLPGRTFLKTHHVYATDDGYVGNKYGSGIW